MKILLRRPALNGYDRNFLYFKQLAEQQDFDFSSPNKEPYNQPVTIKKLQSAIESNKNTAPGPDGIHNNLINNIPHKYLQHIFSVYSIICGAITIFPEIGN